MNILFLFISLSHLNDENSLFASLIHEFKKQGNNVFVATKDNDNRHHSEVVVENNIKVLRVKSHPFTGVANPIKKALAYQEYVIKLRYLAKKHFGDEKIDLILSHSLPPELAWSISGLKSHFNCSFYLLQTDYTWQDAVAFEYFVKNSLICRYYRFWEKQMIKLADYIGCPTKGNIEFLLKEYPFINPEKFQLIPFWQKAFDIASNSDIKEQDKLLKDKFVVVYGGSIGAAQRIEHIIELAEECTEISDIVFLILGRGPYLPVIKKMAEDKKLTNVLFREYLPKEKYMALLGACDVGMIILHEKTGSPNFPSKSLAYLNMGVPILAALDHVTDFGLYLEEKKAGLWAYSDDITQLKKKLLIYYNNPTVLKEVKQNGYNLFKSELQPINAYNTIIEIIRK